MTTNTTMQHPCQAPGCSALRLASTHSVYCPGHRKALAHHGHPLQASITLAQLEPHRAAVRGWLKRNPESPAWAILADRWAALVAHCRGILASRDAGKSGLAFEWQAADLLRQLADTVEANEVTSMALALYLMRDAEPSRFVDERSFRFTLCRRLRKLGPLAFATYWSHKAQRMTALYRYPAPRVSALAGAWLAQCFGAAGLQLAAMERKRAHEKAQEGQRLAHALEALQ